MPQYVAMRLARPLVATALVLSFASFAPFASFDPLVSFASSAPQPQALDWSADDGKRIEALKTSGGHVSGANVEIWFPPALSKNDMEALLRTLDPAVAELRRMVGRHDWQRNGDTKLTYYIADDRFVSHASGRAAVFIPLVRVQDGRAPFLHEVTHELLFPKGQTAGTLKPSERPLWLIEGLPDYIAQTVAAKTGFQEGDVFDVGGLSQVDATCAERVKTADGAQMLPYIGVLGAPEVLFTTDRQRFAPTFYACGFSYTKFLVDKAGFDAVVNLMPFIPQRKVDEQVEKLTGVSPQAFREAWIAKITK